MANTIGAIAVSLGLDAAEYIAGLSKAEYQAQQSMRAISASIDSVRGSFETLAKFAGAAFGLHEIKEWVTGILEGAEQLHNLSIETGSSVENLSKLENIAKISGTSFDTLKSTLDRFAAGMGGADEKTTRVGEALKLLGVSARDPAIALTEAAQKLNTFADGANKAALARELFGKSGVSFLATLKAIDEEGEVSATKTKEQIDNAVALAETYRRLQVEGHALRDVFLQEIVPALTEVIKTFVDARREGGSLAEALKVFANLNPFTSAASNLDYFDSEIKKIEKSIADVKANAGGFWASLSPSSQDTSHLEHELTLLQKGREVAIASQLRAVGGAPSNAPMGFKPQAPALLPTGQADDAARKILEGQLRDLRAASEEEKAILAARNEAVSGYYDAGLISLNAYFSARKDALAEDVHNTAANYAAEVALLQKRIATTVPSTPDHVDAVNKLQDATRKQTLAQITESSASTKLWFEQQKAAEAYRHSVDEISASVLELQGHTADANALRLKNQTEDQRKTLTASGDTAAIAGLDFVAAQKKKQDELSESALKYSNITEKLSIEQGKLDLITQTGLQSEIDGYKAKADLANKYIGVLTDQANAQQKIADSLAPGTAKDAALLQVDRMRLGIDQLKQSADGLKIKLDGIFTDNFTKFLDDITTHTKSVSQAFKDMGKSIGDSILHMVNEQLSKSLYTALFGGGAGSSSPGGALASLLGGGGGAANLVNAGIGPSGMTPGSGGGGGLGAGGMGIIGSLLAKFGSSGASFSSLFGSAGSGLAYGGTALTGSYGGVDLAAAYNSATSSIAGGSTLQSWGDAVQMGPQLPGYASGTDFAPGGVAMVGERGRELVNLPRGAQVVPNHVLAGMRSAKSQRSTTIVQNITNMPGLSRASANQQNADAARMARQAQVRLG